MDDQNDGKALVKVESGVKAPIHERVDDSNHRRTSSHDNNNTTYKQLDLNFKVMGEEDDASDAKSTQEDKMDEPVDSLRIPPILQQTVESLNTSA